MHICTAAVFERHPRSRSRPFDWRWSLLALLLVLIEVAVLVGTAQLTGAGPGESASTMTPYEQLWAQVRPDGTVSKEVALQAFALAIAPLPGVTPPGGAPTPLYERADGTFAIAWLQPYVDQLTPDQKAAIEVALTPDPNAPAITPESGQSDMVLLADDTTHAYYQGLVDDAIPQEALRLNRGLNLEPDVTLNQGEICQLNPKTKKCEAALAYTNTFFGIFGAQGCHIFVNPSLRNSGDDTAIRATMAHETFHCFQFDYFDQHGGAHAVPPWIWEGEAEYAGESIAGPSSVGAGWWKRYLITIQVPLYERGYDALGFYQHMAEEGIDPWEHFDAMLAASTNNDGAFKASGADADVFLDTWASGEFRDGSLGVPWNAQAPWTVPDRSEPGHASVNNGDTVELGTPIQVNEDVNVSSGADLVELTTSTGHIRLHTDPPGDETDTADRWLCTAPYLDGCKCPEGQRYIGPDYETVASDFEVALTGGLTGASGTLTGHSLDNYCKPAPSIPPGTPCKTNCGNSNGDPHIRTVNSFKYDFQAAGEFTLLRSLDGSVQIQARQVGVSRTFMGGVAINTAVAALANGHRIGVYMGPSGLVVHVDGALVDASTPIDLGSGAAVRQVENGVEVDFPDGTILWALSVAEWGINAIAQPSDDLRATGRGLLGSIVRGGLGVPAMPDGTRLPAAVDEHQRFTEVYGPFADAWRVTDATSLFDYDAGQSTATFIDRSFPTELQVHAYSSFPPDTQAAAESACSAITDTDLLSDCEFDVAATGQAGYADLYAAQQDFYDSGIIPATQAPPSSASVPPSSPSSLVSGATKVTDLAAMGSTVMGDGNTLYAVIQPVSGTPPASIVAVDAPSAAITANLDVENASTQLKFAAGSLWVTDLPGAVSSGCSVTRLDGSSLAQQNVVAVPCSPFGTAEIVSDGAALWVTDYSSVDISTAKGVLLRRIDPATDQLDAGVPLPDISGGYFIDSQGAFFYWSPNAFLYRLRDGQATFDDFGNPSFFGNPLSAGLDFWVEGSGGGEVQLFTDPGTSVEVIPVDGSLVAGDDQGIYEEVLHNDGSEQLWRQKADGSAPVQVAGAPIIDGQGVDYFASATTKYATLDGFVALWTTRPSDQAAGALYLQWVPRP